MSAFGRAAALRGALMITGSTYFVYGSGLLASALIARAIGPDDFGRYAYIVWLAGLLGTIANNGLTTCGIRFVSECIGRGAPDDAARVHGWLLRQQVAWIVGVAVVYVLLLPWATRDGWQSQHLAAFTAIALVAMAGKSAWIFLISIGKGYGRFDIEAWSTIWVSLLNLGAVGVLLLLDAPLMAYLALFAVAGVGHFIAGLAMLRGRTLALRFDRPDPLLRARLRTHLVWTMVLTLTSAFGNKSVETWMLNREVGPAEVGFFAIAAALTRGGIDLLSSGLSTVLMPTMAHAYGANGVARLGEVLADAARLFMFFGLLLAGVGTFWAEPAILLLYGSEFQPAVMVLVVMVVVGGLTLPEGAFGAALSTTDNQRLRAILAGASIVYTLVLCILLIPSYGLVGAVVAHAISRVLVYGSMVVGLSRTLGLRLPLGALARQCLAAAIAAAPSAALVHLVGGGWIGIAGGLLFAAAFVAASVLLGAWRESDVATVSELVARFPRLARVAGPWLDRLGRLVRARS